VEQFGVAIGAKKLLENEAVVAFLQKKYPEFLQEFSSLGNAVALDQ
jgi:hypothetical protein